MRQNAQRRAALLDAAIEVLASQGSRGLTLRAVDQEAGVPTGTASNYFANRAELLSQIMARTSERITPDPDEMAETLRAAPTRDLCTELLRQTHGRMKADRSSWLAMLELRLEGTRRPELGKVLNEIYAQSLRENIRFHLDAHLPGDDIDVVLLYLAVHAMIIDDLTVPDVLAQFEGTDLFKELTYRLLPESA